MTERLGRDEERALRRLLRARDLQTASRIEAVRGGEAARLASSLLVGLDASSPRAVEIEVELLRRRAHGLETIRRARGVARWASVEVARARRDLAGGP